jgi:hypothetical protein
MTESELSVASLLTKTRHTPPPGLAFGEPMTGSSGISSTPQLFDSITDASEYWIARWSLSSGGAMRRPGGGR